MAVSTCKEACYIEFKNWLGGRDSNPDNMLQRHASYRWTTSQCQPRAKSQETLIIAG